MKDKRSVSTDKVQAEVFQTERLRTREQKNLFPLCLCVFVFILFSLASCERRDITYYLESELYIRADWAACALPDEEVNHGATTVVFTPVGIGNKQILMGTRDEEVFRVPQGTYHAIIFNRSPDGFSSIRFTGDDFESYAACARQVETRTDPATRVATRVLLTTPEELAADVVTGFTVTEGMLGNYSETSPMNRSRNRAAGGAATRAEESDPERYTLRFTPRKLTRKVKVEIHIDGINNLRNALATVDGVSESVRLCSGQPSTPDAVQQFDLSAIAYDEGSPFNGTLSGDFNVFGFDVGKRHTLTLDFLLVDNKTRVRQTLEATAEELPDGNGELVISLHVVSSEPLPTVKPEGSPDSGFDADVEEWGDPEESEIPI